jgi:hypothetical protein
MSLRDKIKARKPKEILLQVDGDKYLVRGMSRVAKGELVRRCSNKSGGIDSDKLEAETLAACVLDPETQEQVMPDPNDWDVPADFSAPLVSAAISVCGFDSSEIKEKLKNLEATDS